MAITCYIARLYNALQCVGASLLYLQCDQFSVFAFLPQRLISALCILDLFLVFLQLGFLSTQVLSALERITILSVVQLLQAVEGMLLVLIICSCVRSLAAVIKTFLSVRVLRL